MKNILYFTNLNYYNSYGYNKKIDGQIQTLLKYSSNIYLAFPIEEGMHVYYCNDKGKNLFKKYNFSKYGIINKFYFIHNLLILINNLNIDIIYCRYPRADFNILYLFSNIKKHNKDIKIIYELPTYPYEKESNNLKSKVVLIIDKISRKYLKLYVNYIVIVASKFKLLFGIPVLSIENGININDINIIQKKNILPYKIRLLFVGNLSYWHGLDILLKSLNNSSLRNVYECHVISPITNEVRKLRKMFCDLIEDKILFFHGEKYNKELDDYYSICDIGIGTLAFHRSNVSASSVLKIREYLSRGLPFIYSGNDESIKDFDYGLNMEIDEREYFNFERLHAFAIWVKSSNLSYEKFYNICKSRLSWEYTMKNVISVLKED